ncbi:sulfatase family protein [Catenovulum adriaticum]|uniref:Sulfatase n=1 Tax=Catenovulum adriaticum TaxID=2984846 RepID=A0ABY7AQN7_9ALTE|nr:sulfatase [Catenovulum sp. TS8]WAJ71863.1 sulfatase [Catenovulum sp. TS8]
MGTGFFQKNTLFFIIILNLANTGCSQQQKLTKKQIETRPNILWLTFEDTSANELSIYGNTDVKNPNLETLAQDSLVFKYAYSNAPYCSPARSSLISGSYATTFGTDHHRAKIQSPTERIFFPALLQKAGYFTSNNTKRDYNTPLNNHELKQIWTEFDKNASYNSLQRKPNQPFFSVYNAGMTHMSRLTSFHLEQRRDFTLNGIPSQAHPGQYLPNLEAVKSDYQFHLEGVFDVDRWLKFFIDDLKQQGLYEDTIIFVYSDHGGSSPRGKGFIYNSGTHVPLIVRVPEKYQHLIQKTPSQLISEVVEFVDFAPSVLSLAGIKPPAQMQGKAFLGEYAQAPQQYAYTFRTNQETHFDPWRGVTDGRFNYFKTYLQRKPISLRNAFQWGMPSNMALDEFATKNPNSQYTQTYYQIKQTEYLFDLKNDPDETNNLANNPNYQQQLNKMRALVDDHIASSNDLGFIPVAMKNNQMYGNWFNPDFSYPDYIKLINKVSRATLKDLAYFEQYLQSTSPVARFWAANAIAELAAKNELKQIPTFLLAATQDQNSAVKMTVYEALVYLDQTEYLTNLLANLNNDHAISALETLAYIKPDVFDSRIDELMQQINNEKIRSILANLKLIPPTQVATQKYKNTKRD